MSSLSRTRRGLLSVAVCSGLMYGLSGPAAKAATTNTVRIEQLQGEADLLLHGNQRWSLAQVNQTMQPLDRLRTKANSRVTLRWSDQSVATFHELTEIELLPPHAPDAVSGLHLVKGIFSFLHRDKPGRIRVITRGAVAGVEGTEFVMEVAGTDDAERTTLSLIDGRVRFGNDLGELVLTNGQQAVAAVGVKPMLTAGFVANNILQWCFYYPAVLDPTDLPLSREERQILRESLAAYASGDLLAALAGYPAGRQPTSDAERVYLAALHLSVGQVAKIETVLAELPTGRSSDRPQRLAIALRQLIAAVKRQPNPSTQDPQLPSELLAASYYEQSRATGEDSLRAALELARRAAVESPQFSFAWARVAELEFSFGRSGAALEAVEKSLALAPRNAQALALKGFLLAGRNKTREAIDWFNRAIAADSALGNAWLGRGLCRIRRGDADGGREDLLVAAALEPQRAFLRSYLGKAYGDAGDPMRARHELNRAKQLDPADPTAWLYSALLNEQHHLLNPAVGDLEKSKELNGNRLLYRSTLLLDEDRAVRSANLARIYAEAGMPDVAVREAARSVVDDYGNYSAHYFLANSYNNLRRANRYDLRYETAAFSEYLLANLLGPADGSLLAQPISQQEYTRLFTRDSFGFSSSTEYLSRGAWTELAVQYGTFENSSYALEVDYLWDPGQARHSQFEQKMGSASFKQMLTPQDGLYVEALYLSQKAEDIAVKYDPDDTVAGYRTSVEENPSLLTGYDHRWNERNRTLLLTGHLDVSLDGRNPYGATYLLQQIVGNPIGFVATDLTQADRNRQRLESFELQHIARGASWQTIVGIRYQQSVHENSSEQTLEVNNASGVEIYFGLPGDVITNQTLRLTTRRLSPYLYQHWQVADPLWLIGGVSYDYQEQPRNLSSAPFSDALDYVGQVSPKAALVWTPGSHSTVRGAVTRSLGSTGLEQSVRLEPAQVAGFVQSYRDIIPASLGYSGVAGSRVDTADLSLESRLSTRTYVALGGQLLRSATARDVGIWQREIATSSGSGLQSRERIRYQERTLTASVHQLLDDMFSVGLRYRLSEARLSTAFADAALPVNIQNRKRGMLHALSLQPLFRHPSGFFAGADGLWWSQELQGDLAGLKDDAVWQANAFLGYRSPRRHLELTVGILNLTDQDYRIHPINLYSELPRERTFFTRVILNF